MFQTVVFMTNCFQKIAYTGLKTYAYLNQFRPVLCPGTRWGSWQRSPRPLAVRKLGARCPSPRTPLPRRPFGPHCLRPETPPENKS